jgi:hypothetical protein
MLLVQTAAQTLGPLTVVPQLDPHLLLALLVALLFLILFVIGGFTAWSRARRLQRNGQEREDQEWREELMRKIAQPDEKSSISK